jgi:hypothetical protein
MQSVANGRAEKSFFRALSSKSRLRSGMKHLEGGTTKTTVALGASPYAPLILSGTNSDPFLIERHYRCELSTPNLSLLSLEREMHAAFPPWF